ncbi:MAG: hypothetical protein V4857_30560 [Pseudomonadota bacterium]
MKTTTLESFLALAEELGHAFADAVRYGLRAVAKMSWPMLVVTCILLAAFLTVAPLALFLFIIFMALKLIAGDRVQPEPVRETVSLHKDGE